MTTVRIGDIIEGCNLHFGPAIEVDEKGDYVKHRSLLDGKEYGCSLTHCGVFVMLNDELVHKLLLYKEGGMDALVAEYRKS